MIARAIAAAIAAGLGEVPKNDRAYTYTIPGFDGSPYLTRTLLPRVFGYRPLIHHIWRADADPYPHNHPWRDARFMVISGGYTDERWYLDGSVWRSHPTIVRSGDVNRLDATSFHRVIDVLPDTWTIGVVGERVQEWGFLVDGQVVPWMTYFNSKAYEKPSGAGVS